MGRFIGTGAFGNVSREGRSRSMRRHQDRNINKQQQVVIIEVGQKIREVRREHKLTQEQLAQQVGVSRVTINQIENGRRKQFKPDLIHKVATATATPIEYLYGTRTKQGTLQEQLPPQNVDLPSELDSTLSQIRSLPWPDQKKLGYIIGQLVNWYTEEVGI
jgi:putative transcriptional regulator